MKLESCITDNIAELLLQIVKFTQKRQKVLFANINQMHSSGFIPMDMPLDEFCDQLNLAICEHTQKGRLLMCNTEHIKYQHGGDFDAEPIPDQQAQTLLNANRDEYLETQITKLLENTLNQRLATEMLKQNQQIFSLFD